MDRKDFYHDVIAPFERLKARTCENVCIDPEMSDILTAAKLAAIATYHFREVFLKSRFEQRIPQMKDDRAEQLRQMLCDVSDTSKHGKLTNKERTVSLHCRLAYEFNDGNYFRFLRTQVIATNARFGTFEVVDTIEEILPHMRLELGLDIKANIQQSKFDFLPRAETFITNSSFAVSAVRVAFFKRDKNDTLILADPQSVDFAVLIKDAGADGGT